MEHKDVLAYQEKLAQTYNYKPLPAAQRNAARALYQDNLPDGFCLDGQDVPLFAASGLKLCSRYNRIVVGDYGAFVEILPDDIVHENICVKKGQEYRDTDARYSKHTKYSWLTTRDDSDIKITYQKKPVGYADFVTGRYYVSPYDCMVPKAMEEVNQDSCTREMIKDWLKEHGVYSEELENHYFYFQSMYRSAIVNGIVRNHPPAVVDFWLYIHDILPSPEKLTYQQYEAIWYNLSVIDCGANELFAQRDALTPEVRQSVDMGLEGLEFPYEIQNLPPETIRALLRLSADDLLCVSKFSKVLAGCKAEEQLKDVDTLIQAASDRVPAAEAPSKEYSLTR